MSGNIRKVSHKKAHIRSKYTSCYCGKAPSHDHHKLRHRHLLDEWFDKEGRLSLAYEDVPRCAHSFGTRGPHSTLHHERYTPHG